MNRPALAPTLNASGNYGWDPLTNAPITDRTVAQNWNDPRSGMMQNAASYMRSSPPTMTPAQSIPGGGGGGGGRMGPQAPRRKTMTLGPRTAAEYTAENGGLSTQRTSTLDNAYGRGDLSRPGIDQAIIQANENMERAFNDPHIEPDQFRKGLDQMDSFAEASGFATGTLPNGDFGYIPKPMSKGGPMKIGSKPYLVGEEGPELIMPRQNGQGYVLPADVTKQILPMMTTAPTPRKQGGPMIMQGPVEDPNAPVMRSNLGTYATLNSPYGIGSADSSSTPVPLPGQRGISDEIGMVAMPPDRQTLHNQVSQPMTGDPMQYQADPLAGTPWGNPTAAPGLDRRPLTDEIATRNAYISKTYPMLPAASFDMVTDGVTKENIPMADMKQRMAVRGLMYGDDIRDRNARNQTQLDLAARANRAPLGTPTAPATQIPGLPAMRPSAAADIQRQQERFLRTPEGAQFSLANQQQSQLLSQRADLAARAIPVTDPATGQVMGYTNGLGASLPNPNRSTRTVNRQQQIEGQWYNFFADGSAEPINVAGTTKAAPIIAWDGTKTVELPAGTDTAALPIGLTLLPQTAPATGTAKPDTAKPTAAPVSAPTQADYDRLTPGTRYTAPDGKVYTKK